MASPRSSPKTSRDHGKSVELIPRKELSENSSLYRTVVLRQGELVPLFQTKLGQNNVTGYLSCLGIAGEGSLTFSTSINHVEKLPDAARLMQEETTQERLDHVGTDRPQSENSQVQNTTTSQKESPAKPSTTSAKSNQEHEQDGENYDETDVLSLKEAPKSVQSQRDQVDGSNGAGISSGYTEDEAAAVVKYYVHRPPNLAYLRDDNNATKTIVDAYFVDESTIQQFVIKGDNETGKENLGEGKSTVKNHVSPQMLAKILQDRSHSLTRAIIRRMQQDGFDGWWLQQPDGSEELLLFNPRAHVFAAGVVLEHPRRLPATLQLIFAHPHGQATPMVFRRSDTIGAIRHVLQRRYPALAKATEISLEHGEHVFEEDDNQKTIEELGLRNNALIHIKPSTGQEPKKQQKAAGGKKKK